MINSVCRALLEEQNLGLITWRVALAAIDHHHIPRVIDDILCLGGVPLTGHWVLLDLTHLEIDSEHIAARGDQLRDALEEQIQLLAVAVTRVVGQHLAVLDCAASYKIKLANSLAVS